MSRSNPAGQQGFTLVEVMVALLVGGLVMAAVMTAFRGQHATYLHQDQAAEMQQNLRVAMDMLSRDIRMAGYDPTRDAGAEIATATVGRLGFTMDMDADGTIDTDEDITYGFSNANDDDANGMADDGAAPLGRNTGGGFQPVAENIQSIEFVYLMADGTRTLAPAELDDIRGIQVTLLVRTANADSKHTDSRQYLPASTTPLNGWDDDPATLPRDDAVLAAWGGPFNDGYRRRMQTQTIKLRNLGLE